LIGLHASFTLADGSLSQIREVVSEIEDWGIHIHVSEDVTDELDAKQKGYPSVVQRLGSFELLNNNSVLAHGLHINPEDRQTIIESGATLVHNPSSNANNRVGILPIETIQALQPGLGTDGKNTNMLAEAREGIMIRSAQTGGDEPMANYLELLFHHNAAIATRLFGHPIGRIESGYQADLAVYDYYPRTEVHPANLGSHILNGLTHPCHVLTRGEYRVRDYTLVQEDEGEAAARARTASTQLWAAMQKI
jgi:cytosine/adenosine deaminase-related metal-dependent hydrolase